MKVHGVFVAIACLSLSREVLADAEIHFQGQSFKDAGEGSTQILHVDSLGHILSSVLGMKPTTFVTSITSKQVGQTALGALLKCVRTHFCRIINGMICHAQIESIVKPDVFNRLQGLLSLEIMSPPGQVLRKQLACAYVYLWPSSLSRSAALSCSI